MINNNEKINSEINKIKFNIINKNISEFLIKITDKSKYTDLQIFKNLKNCLYGYNANIYSCGTSFNDFNNLMPIDSNTIKICIKGTFNKIIKPDIFIFDNRINSGGRINDKFILDNIFKIYMGDYFFCNYKTYVNNLSEVYNFPKNNKDFLNPDLILTPSQKYSSDIFINPKDIKIFNDDLSNNIIYGNYNIYVPLIYRVLYLFKYMGINQFNITGVDIITSDFSQKHYFEKDVKIKQIGHDTLIYLYYEYILNYSKFNIKLYSNNSNANINIPRYKNIDTSYHIIHKINNISVPVDKSKFNYHQLIYLKLIELIINENINVILPNKIFNFNKLINIIKILNKFNIPINFDNIISLHIDVNFNLLPSDFNPKIYKIINNDLKNLDKLKLILHYINNSNKEKRKYKCVNIPKDFDYIKYKSLNPDLQKLDRLQLILHYENYGFIEKRKY